MLKAKKVLITGGAGYVGSVLVPRLLDLGVEVTVIDLMLYGEDHLADHKRLRTVKDDIRNTEILEEIIPGHDAVIHLACISNDPSFELNPSLSRSINFDAFEPLVRISREKGVHRFIYASSASVYGLSDAPEVTEDHPLVPITDYNKYKALCEPILLQYRSADFIPVIIRPSTLCGFAPRQRFDLVVNLLSNHAVNTRKITVFGGKQKRPNLHIQDMVDLYVTLLECEDSQIAGKIYNASYENHTVDDLAQKVKKVVEEKFNRDEPITITTAPSDDIRSYHISSKKIEQELGFIPKRSIEDAIKELCQAFASSSFQDPMSNPMYFNIKRMQELELSE